MCLLVVLPSLASAGHAVVENYLNDDIFVAIAYRHFKGTTKLFAEGWFPVKRAGDKRTFAADDADDMYLRVIRGGNEVTFPNHRDFLFFPVHLSEAFSASQAPDDRFVDILRWGPNLKEVFTVNNMTPNLPAGWARQRFFRIGSQRVKLELRP